MITSELNADSLVDFTRGEKLQEKFIPDFKLLHSASPNLPLTIPWAVSDHQSSPS